MATAATNKSSLPRKTTAIGTVGELGQLFTVYESNWHCKDCGQENYASRKRCFRCRKQKPEGEANYVEDPALVALKTKGHIAWQEVIDPASYQIYYYNKETGQTQWERPEEMGPTPFATGWFGRGQAGSTVAQKYASLNAIYLSRPARKQKEFIDPKLYHTEGSQEYNIWYGRYIGDMPDRGAGKEAAPDRCVVERDAGYTRADSGQGGAVGKKDRRFFCLHFARGMCAKGKDCIYYHRVPLPEDDARCDELFDCFGRSKHNAHRDDMNGVGSFMKPCRTLFVGNLLKHKYDSPKALEDAMWKHFEEWGELESINVIHRLSIAFPRYRLRTSTEFAKEAMSCQALDQGEILSIRWAHDDPNPVAQDAISRADKDAMAALLQAKGISLQQAAFEYPATYVLPDSKRARVEGSDEGSGGANELAAMYPELAYPNTDDQYQQQPQVQHMTEEQYLQYYSKAVGGEETGNSQTALQQSASLLAQSLGIATTTLPLSSSSSASVPSAAVMQDPAKRSAELEGGDNDSAKAAAVDTHSDGEWTEHLDPDTGATYYYNASTGESSWTA